MHEQAQNAPMNSALHLTLKSLAALGMTLGTLCLGTGADSPPAAEALLSKKRPLIIAHRGYSAAAPENTLPSFQLAIEAGADLVELDYHHTRDNVLTVVHDHTLDRTTDAVKRWGQKDIAVSQVTFEETRTLDASSWRGSNQPPARIPSLTEALDLIQRSSVTLIERKDGPPQDCVRLLRERRLLNQVIVQSFDWNYLTEYHHLEPSQILGALGPWNTFRGEKLTDADKKLSTRWIQEAVKTGARVVVWNAMVDAESVRQAHQHHLQVWIYTIDDPLVMNRLLEEGVDGIITNNPGRAWKILAERMGRK